MSVVCKINLVDQMIKMLKQNVFKMVATATTKVTTATKWTICNFMETKKQNKNGE